MAINFPNSPSNGDTHVVGLKTFVYNSTTTSWSVQGSASVDITSITGDILPDTDSSRSLGSASKKWKELYLSSSTIFLGDSGSISAGSGGEIILPSIKIGKGANAVKLEADGSGKLKTKSIVSGVTQAAEEPGNATTVANMAGLIALTGMSTGQIALVSALNRVFMYTGTGWFKIADMTNATPTDITGVNATYSLAKDGTATTITAVSTDPEGFPLTWSYAVTAGSLGSTATVAQADNVFTITPSSTEADAGEFSITFSVTDGATGAVSVVSAFSLSFESWATPALQTYLFHNASPLSNDYIGQRGMTSTSNGNNILISGPLSGGGNQGIVVDYTRSGTTWTAQTAISPGSIDPDPSQYFGVNPEISGDGNTFICSSGGWGAGAVHIYTKSGSTWSEQEVIRGNDASWNTNTSANFFGGDMDYPARTLAISYDGNTIAASTEDESGGRVFIFVRSGSAWSHQQNFGFGQVSNQVAGNLFGRSMAMSSDGNTLAIGAPQFDLANGAQNAGAVYIFTRSGTTWTEHARLESDVQYDDMGRSTDMTPNGMYIVSGGADIGTGYVSVWVNDGSGNWSRQAKLQNSDNSGTNSEQFGNVCEISDDGTTILATAPYTNVTISATTYTDRGRAYIFTRSGTTWTETSIINPPSSPAYDTVTDQKFGEEATLSGDGSTAFIYGSNYTGGPASPNGTAANRSGMVFVYIKGS
jgi:hypothetical protein